MAPTGTSRAPIPRRPVRFEHRDDLELVWTPDWPELACVANAVSLLMPHVEPFLARSVRSVRDRITTPDLRRDLDAYVAQELSHHAQHREFNRRMVSLCPSLGRIERWIDRVMGWLGRRSPEFAVAFGAGGETVAYCTARWVAPRMATLFRGADPVAASMFVWHLAEEVEHKRVAFDVFDEIDGSRWRLARGMATAFAFLATFTIISTMAMLVRTRRVWNPLAHLRLLVWGVQFAFSALPVMAMSLTRSHHPDQLVDPSWYAAWLGTYDEARDGWPRWQPPARVAS
jgi:predicted metal-dependent hydrolase